MIQTENIMNASPLIFRNLLKEATALKKEKKYIEACHKLREAYSVDGSRITISDRLRLPMYLQLAGRADEGWGELNRLNVTYVDQFSQISIAAYMAKFLRKEGNYRNAVMFAIWELCKRKEVDMDAQASIAHRADQKPEQDAEWKLLGLPPRPEMQATGTTSSGNPIYDVSYPAVCSRLNNAYTWEAIRATLELDLVKIVTKEIISDMATDLSCLLAKTPPYDIESVRKILAKHLGRKPSL